MLYVKNKWPLCHAWHHMYLNCSNSWCFSWAQTQIHSTSCVKLWLWIVHLAFYERTYFLFVFCTSFSRPLLKDIPGLRKDRMTDNFYFSASPLLKNNWRSVWKKKKNWIKLSIIAKKRFVLEKKRMNVEPVHVWWHCWRTFPLTCWIIFLSSPLFTCQRKTMLRYRPGCECKMFPIGFLLFASVFISCGFLRKSMDSRDCWDRFFIENLFLLGTINEHLKLTRDEIISWRQIIMSQGVAVN